MTLLHAQSLKRTPLYDRHVALGAKMGSFGGWELPIYYSGILAEHRQVRSSCGFFDVSHLGEIRVHGKGAVEFLQQRTTNDLGRLKDGTILYSLLLNEQGGVLDDLLIYRQGAENYYLIVNAANSGGDFQEFKRYAPESLIIEDLSDATACLAVQGPKAESILTRLFGFDLASLGYYHFKAAEHKGQPVWISRSGYTGEDGFELFTLSGHVGELWDRLVSEGKALGALPCGLGARDTLRLEAGNALYGSDVAVKTTPFEAGLGFAVDLNKGPFVGRDALLRQREKGPARNLIGFKVLSKQVVREHSRLFKGAEPVGEVTSGSFSPTLGFGIGLGYVRKGLETPGTRLEAEVRDERVSVEIVRRPFVELKHKGKKRTIQK